MLGMRNPGISPWMDPALVGKHLPGGQLVWRYQYELSSGCSAEAGRCGPHHGTNSGNVDKQGDRLKICHLLSQDE